MRNLAYAICLGLVLSAGCGSNDDVTDLNNNQPTNGIQTAVLPAGAENRQCDQPPPTPAFCDWLVALDGLYFGDIIKMEMTSEPMVLASAPNTEVSTCPSGIINHSMAITIAISDTVYGTPRPGSEITFVMGVHQLDELEPRPVLDPTEGLVWGTQDTGLKVGDRLGVPVHKSTIGTQFGRMGQPLFTQKADGTVVAQVRASCEEPVAAGLADRQLDEIRAEITGCTTSEAAIARRVAFEGQWQTNKIWTNAAMCFE